MFSWRNKTRPVRVYLTNSHAVFRSAWGLRLTINCRKGQQGRCAATGRAVGVETCPQSMLEVSYEKKLKVPWQAPHLTTMSYHTTRGYITRGHITPGHDTPGHTTRLHTTPGHTTRSHTTPGHATPGHNTPDHNIRSHHTRPHATPSHTTPGHTPHQVTPDPWGKWKIREQVIL